MHINSLTEAFIVTTLSFFLLAKDRTRLMRLNKFGVLLKNDDTIYGDIIQTRKRLMIQKTVLGVKRRCNKYERKIFLVLTFFFSPIIDKPPFGKAQMSELSKLQSRVSLLENEVSELSMLCNVDSVTPITSLDDTAFSKKWTIANDLNGKVIIALSESEKFVSKLAMKDPVTDKPRFGEKTSEKILQNFQSSQTLKQSMDTILQIMETGLGNGRIEESLINCNSNLFSSCPDFLFSF